MPEITFRLSAALADRYRLERELGEGGMATVYLAHDLKHDRKVALKVLKPELAAVLGAERFVVEIKTTAALQHPHILPLFDSGTADGFLFYVMPFVDGETLRDKLNRETQLGVDEAVGIAIAVADALDYAHRNGVIHRDIKPENILLHDGRPMVADFGIALALSAAAGGRMTETGLSLGTPHYMSPEQATAEKEITGRSDLYSLASVLYEMLTGNPPHVGASAQQIIMKIVTEEAAPVTSVRKSVPANVAAAVARSLEKLPADRFESAKAFADALGNPAFSLPAGSAASAGLVSRSARASLLTATVGLAVLAIVAVIGAAWGWLRPVPPAPVTSYLLRLPEPQTPEPGWPVPTPSPEGSFLVYHGSVERDRPGLQLWIKRRASHGATPIPGTLDAGVFTVSPDEEWIAFSVGGQLKKVPVVGGAAVTLVASGVANAGAVAWLDDESIVFVAAGRQKLGRVPAGGGTVLDVFSDDTTVVSTLAAAPGGRALFTGCSTRGCDIWLLDLPRERAVPVLRGAVGAQYAATGHIVYRAEGDDGLLAVPFDLERNAVRGSPVPLIDSVAQDANAVRLSRSGTLVMRGGGGGSASWGFGMVWVDRTGRETPVDTGWAFQVTGTAGNHGWSLSPDGARLAIGLATEAGDDIWVKQLPRGPLSRITFDPSSDYRPRWTPDGRSITFGSLRNPGGLYQRRADGTGADSLLVESPVIEGVWSPDGAWLILRLGGSSAAAGGRDITGLRLGVDSIPGPVLATPFDEDAIALSPDGRWLAYQSDETGLTEVYIRSFPDTDALKRQVSNGGGTGPLWSRDGRELFYLSGAGDMMAARITRGATLEVGQPAVLFHVPPELRAVESFYYTPWDVAPDGRFIMARLHRPAGASDVIIVVENFLTELKAKVGK